MEQTIVANVNNSFLETVILHLPVVRLNCSAYLGALSTYFEQVISDW